MTRSRLMPGPVSPLTGCFPHISPTSGLASRGPGGGVSPPPPRPRGEPPPWDTLSACPWGPAPTRHTARDRRVHRAGEASGQSHKAVTATVTGRFGSPGGTLVVTRGDDTAGRDRVLSASRVVRVTHPRMGRPFLPRFPAYRGRMASSAAPDAVAAMAVHREAEGAGALLGPEEDIDDGVLSNLLSASWPTPAVVVYQYGRYSWAPLGGSIVEQRFDADDSGRMPSIWTTIRGMYESVYAVSEGTGTDFPFRRSWEDWRVCQVLRVLAVRNIPPGVKDEPHISREYFPGSPPKLGEGDRGL